MSTIVRSSEDVIVGSSYNNDEESVSLSLDSEDMATQFHVDNLLANYRLAELSDNTILQIGNDIITQACRVGKSDIKVSRTGDNEILFYRKHDNGDINNIILDKDCDITFLSTPNIRANSYRRFFDFININDELIVELVDIL